MQLVPLIMANWNQVVQELKEWFVFAQDLKKGESTSLLPVGIEKYGML